MNDWSDREERQAAARAQFEHIMTTPSPGPQSAYLEAGVIGYVFAEMWRRGVLTPRDRRWITLSCVGAMDATIPIDTHVWAALNSGDVSAEEFDEFVLFFATQLGWPKASALSIQGAIALSRLAEERGGTVPPLAFVEWADPVPDGDRHARGDALYEEIHGCPAPPATTAFRRDAYLDYLYGEIWSRGEYLTRRDRRIVSICCSGIVAAEAETRDHLRAALVLGDLSYEELQELVVHYAVYVGWPRGRVLDDLVVEVGEQLGER